MWEQSERCLWQIQRGERVAVVEKMELVKREHFFGYHNRTFANPSLTTRKGSCGSPSWNTLWGRVSC